MDGTSEGFDVPLHSRKYPGLVATVSAEDYERVMQHHWWPKKEYKTGNFYARARVTPGSLVETTLHAFVMRLLDVDHIDGDGLNCRRSNLREATRSQQAQNRCKVSALPYKGISQRPNGKYQGQIKVGGRNRCLGTFLTAEEAARAYDIAAREAFGEFACLNFGGNRVEG